MKKEIAIGKVKIGGKNAVAIQSMLNVPSSNLELAKNQLAELQKAGCDIVRVAVPNLLEAEALKRLKDFTTMPIVADTHFNSQLTVKSIENGADKVRINPGNMSVDGMKAVVDCAKMHGVPIRIGINGGSVNREILNRHNGNQVDAVVDNLTQFVQTFEKLGFFDIVLSAKCSDVKSTVLANRMISNLFDYPLHIGVTEAGLLTQGVVKNSIGIGALLLDGIGDTVRVSLTANPVEEIFAAKEILKALGLFDAVTFVSCPKCGRCGVDLEHIASKVFEKTKDIKKKLKIAVMGCEVNGPGECLDADLGMACGKEKVAFFKNGKVFRVVDEKDAIEEFSKELKLLC